MLSVLSSSGIVWSVVCSVDAGWSSFDGSWSCGAIGIVGAVVVVVAVVTVVAGVTV